MLNRVISKLLILSLLCALPPTAVLAGESVRFYELTKKDQQNRIFKLGSMQKPGCHNFIFKKKIHRFSQVGFAACKLYAQKNCPADTVLSATWGGKKYRRAKIDIKQPQTELLPGSEWMLGPRNVTVGSWHCTAIEK